MQYFFAETPETGRDALATTLADSLEKGLRVLWLLPGGSNVEIAASAMQMLEARVPKATLKNLTVGQVDERFGPVGHPDSNWKQLIDAGFPFEDVVAMPILTGEGLEETVRRYGNAIEEAYGEAGLIVGQFGIGADGHIAGMLPHSAAVNDTNPAAAYVSDQYTRFTLTPRMLLGIDVAYVFAFGASKKGAIDMLRQKELSFDEEPAQILKKMRRVFFYTDQVKPEES